MSRTLLRSVLELRTPATRLLPSTRPTAAAAAATGPLRAAASLRLFNQTAQHIEPVASDSNNAANANLPSSSSFFASSTPSQQQPPAPTAPQQQQQQQAEQQRSPAAPKPLSESVRTLLPILAAQPGHYITVHIQGQRFLVTAGDSVRLPFRLRGVVPGDVLRLTRASVLGSRDFTLRGAPYVDERLFECRAVVTGTESEPLRIKIKKKRRCRREKHVKSKHRYTILRISELRVRTEALNEA
ncbi:9c0394e1-d61d-45b6-b327-a56e49593758 [Thermothielavioides terrestris]|jgi:large subunit ribosomal protein L21|uniref:Large ribosomal subunit protein bL21m n=2 Tax=Thermothielavioides terrestris TaxID=2587410 RepID=G2QYJ6_THETT|nr:uncharacterized protein THITE_2112310 [Thermothielavioides terrestris NRRL 8126]AEO65384.1 hypothetical protein THITE_2112310 [Thermothielavioides terrestris NRRL 8126]SPQ19361.1 9c0394e1-d61d-45b6-b327-a56e49593758 [Thermothielavioides terrestris]